MLGNRSQVHARLGNSLGCCSIWCSWLSGNDNEKEKIEIWYQIPNKMLGHAKRAIPQEVLAAALLWILDEALVAVPLGLPAPFGQGACTLFSPAQDHGGFLSSGC